MTLSTHDEGAPAPSAAEFPASMPAVPPATTHRLTFNGAAGEFTRIWWTNLLLTICTLGIYSAWAKVRTRKWFYGNTELDGSTFNYHADPKAILKGRIIVVGVYMWLALLSRFFPEISAVFFLIVFAVLPWIMVRSLRFNAINSSYRGVRMDFATDYGGAYLLILLKLPVVFLTLGLAWPWWRASLMRFLAQHRYGTAAFTAEVSTAAVYGIYARALAMFVLLIALIGGALVASGMAEMVREAVDGYAAISAREDANTDAKTETTGAVPDQAAADDWGNDASFDAIEAAQVEATAEKERKAAAERAGKMAFVFVVFFYAGLFLYFIFVGSYLDARLTNLLWSRLRLDGVTFTSQLRARDLLWLRISNVFICLFTLFIAYPATQVRNARYRLSRMTVEGNPDHFIAAQRGETSALGEEAGDLLDLDIAL